MRPRPHGETRRKLLKRIAELERSGAHWTHRSLADDLGIAQPTAQGHIERMRRDGLLTYGTRKVTMVLERTLVLSH